MIRKPILFLLLTMLCVVLITSCIYLRLMNIKRQFGAFESYYNLTYEDGLKFDAFEPVLKVGDIEHLFGELPEPRQIPPLTSYRIILQKISNTLAFQNQRKTFPWNYSSKMAN